MVILMPLVILVAQDQGKEGLVTDLLEEVDLLNKYTSKTVTNMAWLW